MAFDNQNQIFDAVRIIDWETRYLVLKRQRWKCNNCGCVLKMSKYSHWDGEVAHIDHIFPFADRFAYPKGHLMINEISNLQALCPDCNLKKGKKIN